MIRNRLRLVEATLRIERPAALLLRAFLRVFGRFCEVRIYLGFGSSFFFLSLSDFGGGGGGSLSGVGRVTTGAGGLSSVRGGVLAGGSGAGLNSGLGLGRGFGLSTCRVSGACLNSCCGFEGTTGFSTGGAIARGGAPWKGRSAELLGALGAGGRRFPGMFACGRGFALGGGATTVWPTKGWNWGTGFTGGGIGRAPGAAAVAMPLSLMSTGRIVLTGTGRAGGGPTRACSVGRGNGAPSGCTCWNCCGSTATAAWRTGRPAAKSSWRMAVTAVVWFT